MPAAWLKQVDLIKKTMHGHAVPRKSPIIPRHETWRDLTPGPAHIWLTLNRTNLGHFGPRSWGPANASRPGSDKEAHQHMEVRSMFGQAWGPLADQIFFELWELWVMKWQMPTIQQRQTVLVGSVFGQKRPNFEVLSGQNWGFLEILRSNIYQGSSRVLWHLLIVQEITAWGHDHGSVGDSKSRRLT